MTLAFSGSEELGHGGGVLGAARDGRRCACACGSLARDQLAAQEVRRGLVALLRGRVPPQDVEDITQTVLCDALASSTMPSEPEDLRRWLTGIARHKIADYHRRSARASARMSGETPESVAGAPPAFEERNVLERLLDEPRTRRDAETMEWLVREHDGERLADIASQAGLPAPVVRQRVSRLRRALRSRWTGVFGAVLLLAGLSALGVASYDAREAITSEPALGETLAPATPSAGPTASAELQGDWRVQSITPIGSSAKKALGGAWFDKNAVAIRVHEKAVDVELDGKRTTFRPTRMEKRPNGATRVHLVGTSKMVEGRVLVVDYVLGKDTRGPWLEATLHDTSWGARVVLRRPTH